MRESDTYLIATPIAHLSGSLFSLISLHKGATVLALPQLNNHESYAAAIEKYKVKIQSVLQHVMIKIRAVIII